MIPITRWTIYLRRISTFWWSAGVFSLTLLTLIFYPVFKGSAAQFEKSLQGLHGAAVGLLGGSTDFFSPVGYLNSQLFFLTLPMVLGILAIALGASLVGREEQDLTIETLLSRPVSRGKLLAAKAAAGIGILSFITFIEWLSTVVLSKLVKLDVPSHNITLAMIACWVLVLSFGAIAFLLTTVGRTRHAALGIAAAVAIGGYLVSSLSGTVKALKGPSHAFPFHYYRPLDILDGRFYWSDILVLLGVVVICGVLSYFAFRRRDIG
jgi:beta-exotoxin I transport system permease protein